MSGGYAATISYSPHRLRRRALQGIEGLGELGGTSYQQLARELQGLVFWIVETARPVQPRQERDWEVRPPEPGP